MRREYITYFTWLGDELVTVPDFPAWVCDVCHRREYDLQALNELSLLLSPNAGKSNPKPRKVPRPAEGNPPRPSQP
jgi:YgiT-type zinc finger domain-containing protein